LSGSTPQQQAAVRAMLWKVVSLDSTFAPAWGRLARAEAWSPLMGFTGDSFPVLARKYARRALALDSNSAEAYDALAVLAWTNFQFDDAVAMERRAVALDPSYSTAVMTLGIAFSAKGESDSAVAYLERATQLDPFRTAAWSNLGTVYIDAGRPNDAVRAER